MLFFILILLIELTFTRIFDKRNKIGVPECIIHYALLVVFPRENKILIDNKK